MTDVSVFVAAAVIFIAQSLVGASAPSASLKADGYAFQECARRSYVQRQGHLLTLCGRLFRFSGANIYWLGLDENVGGIQYPTRFRVDDALETAAIMNQTVVRAHTLGISTGNPLSFEPTLDVFNHDAPLEHIDYAVARANALGLKLIIPLTDNYHYYHGGKHDFTDWYNISDENEFYTDERVIAAFERYVSALLTHTNRYTGRRYAEEPSVLAWETGNELFPPVNWTKRISAFIKQLAPNQLVLSGHFGLAVDELAIPTVDLYSDHYYPPNVIALSADSVITKAAEKVFIVGEYGWSYPAINMTEFFDVAKNVSTCNNGSSTTGGGLSGMLFWSLFPHLDTYGFVQHGDGFSIHYPGDTFFMRQREAEIISFGSDMIVSSQGVATTSIETFSIVPTRPPGDLTCALVSSRGDVSSSFVNVTVSWRGATGACSYVVTGVRRSEGSMTALFSSEDSFSSSSVFVLRANVTDNDVPFTVTIPPSAHAADSLFVVVSSVACGSNKRDVSSAGMGTFAEALCSRS